MKKKLNKIIITILSMIFIMGMSVPAFAMDNSNTISLNASDYSSPVALENDITKHLSDSNVDEVVVLNDECSDEDLTMGDNLNMSRQSAQIYYVVRNVVKKSDVTGSSDIGIATGTPGITLSIGTTESVSTTLSARFGASYALISGAVGWDVTGSTSIHINGSAKVPSTHNGKSVKTMTLHAKPIYQVKSFDVYKIVIGYLETKEGTGTTKKAYGLSYTKTYVYK